MCPALLELVGKVLESSGEEPERMQACWTLNAVEACSCALGAQSRSDSCNTRPLGTDACPGSTIACMQWCHGAKRANLVKHMLCAPLAACCWPWL